MNVYVWLCNPIVAIVIFQNFWPFPEIKELENRQNLNYHLLAPAHIIKCPGFKNVILFNTLASVDEKMLLAISFNKGYYGQQASSHPQICTLKAFRVEKSMILALES